MVGLSRVVTPGLITGVGGARLLESGRCRISRRNRDATTRLLDLRPPGDSSRCRAADLRPMRREHGEGACSECGAPKRRPKPGPCRDCWRLAHSKPAQICVLCECEYVPKQAPRRDRPQPQRFCSKSCKTAWQNGARPPYERHSVVGLARKRRNDRIRRQRHAETWDGVTNAEILERDGWRCRIPGCKRRPIRKDLKYPHLRGKSIDHIVPLSLGGDDTAVNKRAAHLGCNMARGNKAGEEQVALFGVIREPPLATVAAGERAAG